MLEPDLFMIFLKPLSRSNIPYMVTGSVASMIYGEPRVTHDIDLVVELQIKDVSGLKALFGQEQFYCPPEEAIKTEISRAADGHFNIIHHASGFKADIYPAGKDELHKWAMARRQKINVDDCDIWIAPPEYVIIRKLEYYKEGGSVKHLSDIKRLLEVSGDILDTSALKEKIAKYDLSAEWEKMLSTEE